MKEHLLFLSPQQPFHVGPVLPEAEYCHDQGKRYQLRHKMSFHVEVSGLRHDQDLDKEECIGCKRADLYQMGREKEDEEAEDAQCPGNG